MARKAETVRLRIRTSFNNMYEGDEADVVMNDRIRGWIEAGVAEVMDGQDQAGPGGAEQDDHQRVPDGAARGSKAGRESGQSFGAGGYGTS